MSNTPTTDSTNEEKEMSFVEHLDELRIHLIRIVIAIIIGSVFIFFATDVIFKHVIFGPLSADFLTYTAMCDFSHWVGLADQMCYQPVGVEPVTLEMGEAFLLHIKICFFGGLIVMFPYIVWEVWKFVKPALHQKEEQSVKGIVAISSFLFLLGIAFGYFVLAPFAINFLVGYQLPMINAAASTGHILKASSYMNYMIMFTMPVGIIFELPIVVYYLAKLGLVTDHGMRKYRRHAIVAILVVAAFVTPPDVMTQMLIGIPIYFLYEISIGIAARQTRLHEKDL